MAKIQFYNKFLDFSHPHNDRNSETVLQFKGENACKDFVSITLATSRQKQGKVFTQRELLLLDQRYTFKM